MDEIIQIKCPFDGAILSVKNQPGIETRNVTCPICKNKYPFSSFKRVAPSTPSDDSSTQYPGQDDCTSFAPQQNNIIGRIVVEDSGRTFQLKPGRNIIGRKGQKSTADFQIDTAEKRAMSREHIVIEVKKMPAKGFVHYISLSKEKVNRTTIGKSQLLYGDCLILNHGDIINLPDASLRFELPDDEGTQY